MSIPMNKFIFLRKL